MNYCKIYMSIIFKASAENEQRLCNKQKGHYYERHHIIPKSLGGSNANDNVIILTAREHFICHWLLVKMYKPNTIERYKMLHAFHKMCHSDPTQKGCRPLNSRIFSKYKAEYSKHIGATLAIANKGVNNPQYGKKWFTSLINGESKRFYTRPSDLWVNGRNWFHTHGNETFDIKDRHRITIIGSKQIHEQGYAHYSKTDRAIKHNRELWDNFNNGCYNTLTAFCKDYGLNIKIVAIGFKRFIPIYTKLKTSTKGIASNKSLVGVYK